MVTPNVAKLTIMLLASALGSADAFVTVRGARSAVATGEIHSRAREMRNSAPSLRPRHSNAKCARTMYPSSTVTDQITAGVGKTASSVVSVAFFLLLALRRDAVVLTLWLGAILNAILGKALKRLLDHERPAGATTSDGGMPSSHAMSLGFLGASLVGALAPPGRRPVAAAAAATYAALALRHRVLARLHTPGQIAVGLALGMGNALAWLRVGLGDSGDGRVLAWVRARCVSADTGLFPLAGLAVPLAVGVLVVGSFERRIAAWAKARGKDEP